LWYFFKKFHGISLWIPKESSHIIEKCYKNVGKYFLLANVGNYPTRILKKKLKKPLHCGNMRMKNCYEINSHFSCNFQIKQYTFCYKIKKMHKKHCEL
jgi:hypothetical protein